MMQQRGCRLLLHAGVLTIVVASGTAPASAVVIDAFDDATAAETMFIPNTNVVQNVVGSTHRVDSGMTDVIGGVRDLTVTATFLGFPGLDFLIAGVAPANTLFSFDSTGDCIGNAVLLYDRGGAGLNTSLASELGISLVILSADAAAVASPGLDVIVRLTDGSTATASQTRTVDDPVSPLSPVRLYFPLQGFSGVNPADLFSIEVGIYPQEAGDVRLGLLATVAGAPVPTLSGPLMAVAMVVLGVVALWRFRRAGWARRRG